ASSGATEIGRFVFANAGVTVTLPPPVEDALIAVQANSGVTGASPVTVAASDLFGVGVAEGTTSMAIGTPGATRWFQGENTGAGAIRWRIIGARDSGWVPIASSPAGATVTNVAYRVIGDRVKVRGALTNATGSAISGGTTLIAGLPVPAAGADTAWV